MERVKYTIVKFLVVLTFIISIDGGKSYHVIGNRIQINLNQDHINNIEMPYQNNTIAFNEDQKLVESFKFDFSCFAKAPVKCTYTLNKVCREFLVSIWQPPKFI
jgi:hypothetical protein